MSKLKYDDKPDYEKCRKQFADGLKSLGKSNSGDLDFKASSSAAIVKKTSIAITPVKVSRAKISKVVDKSTDDAENISPKTKNSRKLNESSESASPSKKMRTSKASTQIKSTKSYARPSTAESSIVVNSHVNKGSAAKTFNLNLELDISFDTNVVVNVKRKKKKKEEVASPNQSLQSTDEIPPSDKSFILHTTKVYKKASRSSPRTK